MTSLPSLTAGLFLAVLAVALPATAQTNDPNASTGPLSAVQLNQLIASLSTARPEVIAKALAQEIGNNPAAARQVAQALGDSVGNHGIAFVSSVVELTTRQLSAANSGAVGNKVLQQFAAGVTLGVARTSPAQAAQMVQAVTSAAVSGAAKSEATVGLIARVIASGVDEALVTGKTSIPISSIAQIIRDGVSQGASKVVGSKVTVTVLTTDDKPVSDVSLTKANGQKLNPGGDVTFITIGEQLLQEQKKIDVSPS